MDLFKHPTVRELAAMLERDRPPRARCCTS